MLDRRMEPHGDEKHDRETASQQGRTSWMGHTHFRSMWIADLTMAMLRHQYRSPIGMHDEHDAERSCQRRHRAVEN